ncbi:molybdenum cofactor guanylyltransferase [Allostella sp. ATCC 35155]|nr:molybdenum cofactor guanylyltransferase [Stella sp. ATCC 35155]
MEDIVGIVLAGGRARRMGGADKAMVVLAGRTLLDRVIGLARPQVSALAISANGDPRRFDRFGLPVLADDLPGFPGPLAGILAGLDWAAAAHPAARYLASFAGDTPMFPADLVRRLAAVGAPACAAADGRLHPVFGLWPLAARQALRQALVRDGMRRVEDWAAAVGARPVECSAADGSDPFFNINRPEDLAAAERRLAGRS